MTPLVAARPLIAVADDLKPFDRRRNEDARIASVAGYGLLERRAIGQSAIGVEERALTQPPPSFRDQLNREGHDPSDRPSAAK